MKIAVIPIDNRPICYDIISDVLSIDSSCELFMPDIKYLGGLYSYSNRDKIFEFLNNLENIDYLIVCLDTLAYGGLISSRRCEDSFDEIKEKIEKFKNIASKKAKKILAFSSVMRISNNNINEEEKEYWANYGKKIFKWSFDTHKNGTSDVNDIPEDILKDYLDTRKRNFEINKIYTDWAKEKFFDTLIFSKDDCAEFGLNVQEAFELEKIKNNLRLDNVFIKTGADEIPLGLITRAVLKDKELKINPVFAYENSINLISKYEDISVKNCVLGQIGLSGCKISTDEYDLRFYINNFEKSQGDLVLGDVINSSNNSIALNNTFIADINNANGSDNGFIQNIIKNKPDDFFGYCGYNTSANTIGASIFCAVIKYFALKNNTYNDNAFKKYQMIRFLDDWGYQANSRKYVRENASNPAEYKLRLKEKENELNLSAKQISEFLNYYPEKISYSLPWDRSFEIRIEAK